MLGLDVFKPISVEVRTTQDKPTPIDTILINK
jgi:hypothetical protein